MLEFTYMVKREHLMKLKKVFNASAEGINLTHSFLCAIALGEKLSPSFYNNKEAQRILSGLRRYKFVRHVKREEAGGYIVTQKGENKLQKILIDEVVIKDQRKWD